ncbi:BON domain protein [Pseudodesulfovibrio hydrargyri]|uniref:BON domain protein n=1 Tax=Pseudodesulfovibrio hydrargyri TaxID=2125990 RepID=A0A1J5MX34_9BACT|nr:BON domain protein [Pseudodesulfovibrio hydrargyri]
MMPEHATKAALAVILCALLAGCAVYPAVQVAGGAMTGYDAMVSADKLLPRNSVDGGCLDVVHDAQLQRRLRERLALNDLHLSAHVIDAKAYLVGQVASRSRADYAIRTAATVEGIRTITCKFFPAPRPNRPPATRPATNSSSRNCPNGSAGPSGSTARTSAWRSSAATPSSSGGPRTSARRQRPWLLPRRSMVWRMWSTIFRWKPQKPPPSRKVR